jgi:hypothetical protein
MRFFINVKFFLLLILFMSRSCCMCAPRSRASAQQGSATLVTKEDGVDLLGMYKGELRHKTAHGQVHALAYLALR